MLHQELLLRLCRARDSLRDLEECPKSIPAVAREAGVSLYHFIRLYKSVFGETPHQCQSGTQIEKAKQLLILSDYSVTAVCMAVGFSSVGSFSSLFKRRVGVSPAAFQRRHGTKGQRSPRLPAELIPGCFTLMGRISR
ncbi:MAG: helix-turn-helix transcriptional regulator [Opitutae bacterium]|nr:helix-turn-helix transcriptional regulator [Opitutae bacterium]